MPDKHNKRELILDAMQDLMNQNTCTPLSISDIARKAGIGKGSIYYYFPSKNNIIEALIERSYSAAIEKSRRLISNQDIDAFTKMELIFRTCLEASSELNRQEESQTFQELQYNALTHQNFIRFLIRNLKPILSDVIDQGMAEGTIQCRYPREVAEIVLIILTVKLDNHICPSTQEEIRTLLKAFSWMQSKSMGIDKKHLEFLHD